MTYWLWYFFPFLFLGTSGLAQVTPGTASSTGISQAAVPKSEDFINAVYETIVDSSYSSYYLAIGADTCRFTKYDYDEWAKYFLKEFVPMPVLNELSEKVYLSRQPYLWKQNCLQKAICISNQRADTIFSLANPALGRSDKGRDKRTARQMMQRWRELPPQEKMVYSFSLPQFTDDGLFAIVDLNVSCGMGCGAGTTCLFRHTATNWRLIGQKINWSSNR